MNFNEKPIKIFFAYYRPHIKIFLLDMFFAFVYSAIDLVFPMLSKYTLNRLLPNKLYKAFFSVIAIMVAMYVLRSFASWFVTYWGHKFGLLVENDMRRDAFNHVQNQSFSFFDKNRTGHIMSRVIYDLFDITELAHHGPEDLVISALTFLGACALMLKIRWELALCVFAVVPLMVFCTTSSRRRMIITRRKVKETTAEINSTIESSVSGARVTKIFTNEDFEREKFAVANNEYFEAKVGTHKSFADFQFTLEFFSHIMYVIVLCASGILIMHDKMTVADVVAANLFVSAFTQPIRKLGNFAEVLTTGTAGFMRFVEMMRTHEETDEKEDAIELTRENAESGDIVFENVSFAYNENGEVLSNVNLNVPAGKTIALVGTSGGGKTTLCNLLPRFYEKVSGSIKIAGHDVTDYTVKSLRQQIGIVQQDVFLFAGTVRDNIAYGKPDATDEEIIAAAKYAEIYDDIMKMKDGFDSIVGERGIKLSGGQKQRVSIARVFLKNPPILILDEATSALDSATEIRIQHSFDELIKGRTTFVIAHRLSTIRDADIIAVVDEKSISELGTHSQLIAAGGVYEKLWSNQFNV